MQSTAERLRPRQPGAASPDSEGSPLVRPVPCAAPLLGRPGECARITGLLERAEAGGSGALVIHGEAGVGKTALLRYACEQAGSLRLLTAHALESESEIPFVGLADLLRPVVGLLDTIPAHQAAALKSALAIGPPSGGARLSVAAATRGLLASAATTAPLLAVVDDAQWLDEASREALLFTARRQDAERIVLLFAVRDVVPPHFEGIEQLALGGLDHASSSALLEREHARPIAAGVKKRLIEATGGNPLALTEIPALLTDGQLAGDEPIEEPLPVGAALERALVGLAGALPSATQDALIVAAASESEVMTAIDLALARLGLDAVALIAAEDAGLIAFHDERLAFRHPLLRSAVYHTAPAATRRAAHLALAEAFAALGDRQRRAWHLAIAATGPDETVAQALDEAAQDARRRTGYYAAAVAFERAAELSPGDEACARRLFAAAEHLELAGWSGRTLELLDRALGRTRDQLLRADIHHLRCQINLRHRGAPRAAYERLRLEAERIEQVAPAKAALMLVDAWLACKLAGDPDAAFETAERAHDLGRRAGGRAELLGAVCLGDALIFRGEAATGYPLLRRGLTLLADGDLLGRAHLAVQQAGLTLIRIEEYAQARVVLERSLEEARALSAVGILPFALAFLAELDFRTGRWAAAYAGASEARRLSEEAGEVVEWASHRCLAQIEVALGRDVDAREHVSRGLELTAELGLSADRLHAALGLLELGRGRPEEAIAHLARVGPSTDRSSAAAPAVVPWIPDLVESYVRVGREADAREWLERFSTGATATGRVWALAAAARCRGLLAGAREFEGEFATALELHARTPTPFEQARTELCLGERLRRSRRRVEARAFVRSALEAFERLGAEPWAERARSELTASGETARRGAAANSAELTPQELQIALLVAKGATNREVGSALFLSAKTIETHLSRIYRKLEIRSRTELARVLPAGAAIPLARRENAAQS